MIKQQQIAANLTRNQSLVFGALAREAGPLSAYTILDRLRDQGFRAPLQVYRALDKLVQCGLVHRLESLNAFVACSQPECEVHEGAVFTICEQCGDVTEFADDDLADRVDSLARRGKFRLRKSTIELRGRCATCNR